MTQVIAPGRASTFQIYHTLAKRKPHANSTKMSRDQLGTARRMARHDYTVEQIRDALGLTCAVSSFRNELTKFNIRPRSPMQPHRRAR